MAPTRADIAACVRKTRWSSEQSARRALANIRARPDSRMKPDVRPYRCRVRGSGKSHWHLGSPGW